MIEKISAEKFSLAVLGDDSREDFAELSKMIVELGNDKQPNNATVPNVQKQSNRAQEKW